MTSAAKPKPPLVTGESRAYPVLPLRDIVVFPHMIVPLFVGREKSIKALEEVMRSDTFILLATQKNASDDDPAGRSGPVHYEAQVTPVFERYLYRPVVRAVEWLADVIRPLQSGDVNLYLLYVFVVILLAYLPGAV